MEKKPESLSSMVKASEPPPSTDKHPCLLRAEIYDYQSKIRDLEDNLLKVKSEAEKDGNQYVPFSIADHAALSFYKRITEIARLRTKFSHFTIYDFEKLAFHIIASLEKYEEGGVDNRGYMEYKYTYISESDGVNIVFVVKNYTIVTIWVLEGK